MKTWMVRFQENGDEYTGSLLIDATRVYLVDGEDRVIMADGIRIGIDEAVISIEEVDPSWFLPPAVPAQET